MSDVPTYVLERLFDAPRDLIWKTWTDPDLVARWYGPNVETIIHRLDAKPGGLSLVEMKWGEASKFERSALNTPKLSSGCSIMSTRTSTPPRTL